MSRRAPPMPGMLGGRVAIHRRPSLDPPAAGCLVLRRGPRGRARIAPAAGRWNDGLAGHAFRQGVDRAARLSAGLGPRARLYWAMTGALALSESHFVVIWASVPSTFIDAWAELTHPVSGLPLARTRLKCRRCLGTVAAGCPNVSRGCAQTPTGSRTSTTVVRPGSEHILG